jgi:hypothetical protein
MYKLPLLFATGTVVLLAASAPGAGAPRSETFGLRASLDARQEVPGQTVRVAGATGSFVGTVIVTGSGRRISWKLTFSHLSGAATRAQIHYGKRGKAGQIAVGLCAPCKSGTRGTVTVTPKLVREVEQGAAYVNIHTKKNPDGEIRGQIKAVKGY